MNTHTTLLATQIFIISVCLLLSDYKIAQVTYFTTKISLRVASSTDINKRNNHKIFSIISKN